MESVKMYQVSTLQALALGYTKPVIDVEGLKIHGDTGLGTFEGVDGEMIMLDGHCYRAKENGEVEEAQDDLGVPFASVCNFGNGKTFELGEVGCLEDLVKHLNNVIEEDFGLNSMHMVKIHGVFSEVNARSETGYYAIHVPLKDMLAKTQKSFELGKSEGTLVCVYYPDYMDGINAAGWHFHYVSDDYKKGGHVFEIVMNHGTGKVNKINRIEIQLPMEPGFDTYALKGASKDDIKEVEQGKK